MRLRDRRKQHKRRRKFYKAIKQLRDDITTNAFMRDGFKRWLYAN